VAFWLFIVGAFTKIEIVEGQFWRQVPHQAQGQIFAYESHQQSEKLGEQNNATVEKFIPANAILKFAQAF
jgi:hypothetical protein